MRRIGSRALSWLVVAAVTAMLSPVSMGFAAVNNNEVTSPKIKEADGTSGQDTNLGSGVKTGHVQNRAITSAKIGFYSNVIVVAPTGGDFTDPVAAVNSITTASASNPYLVKVMPGVYDVGSTPLYLKPYVDLEGSGRNVTKITGKVHDGGIYTGIVNGSSNSEVRSMTIEHTGGVQVAIAVSNNSAVSLLKDLSILSSGAYNASYGIVGTNGANSIISDVAISISNSPFHFGILNRNSSPKINNASLILGPATRSFGIHEMESSSSTIDNVSIVVETATPGSGDIGINVNASSPKIRNSTVSAEWGVYVSNGASFFPTIKNTEINSVIGIGNDYAQIKIDSSKISATTTAIHSPYGRILVSNSQLIGAIPYPLTLTCVNVYNENYGPNTCQ